jgi:hypothetical protein
VKNILLKFGIKEMENKETKLEIVTKIEGNGKTEKELERIRARRKLEETESRYRKSKTKRRKSKSKAKNRKAKKQEMEKRGKKEEKLTINSSCKN